MVKNIQFTKISFKTAAVSFISNLLVKQKRKKKLHTVTFSELLHHLQIPFSVCSWSICVWINSSTVWQLYPRKKFNTKRHCKVLLWSLHFFFFLFLFYICFVLFGNEHLDIQFYKYLQKIHLCFLSHNKSIWQRNSVQLYFYEKEY